MVHELPAKATSQGKGSRRETRAFADADGIGQAGQHLKLPGSNGEYGKEKSGQMQQKSSAAAEFALTAPATSSP